MLINTSYKLFVAKDCQHKSLIMIPSSFKKIQSSESFNHNHNFPYDCWQVDDSGTPSSNQALKENECQYETLQSHQMDFKNTCLTFFKC